MFITLEGPEGAGKTTQVAKIIESLQRLNIPCIHVREPGGTGIGDRIRQILLDPQHTEIFLSTEILLYAASRAQLVRQVIQPALEEGKVVLCDRFLDSSIVYQGLALDEKTDWVEQVNRLAIQDLHPTRTYLIDIPSSIGLQRSGQTDRIEQKGIQFHEKVRRGFLQLASDASMRIQVIDGNRPQEQVFQDIWQDLRIVLSLDEELDMHR